MIPGACSTQAAAGPEGLSLTQTASDNPSAQTAALARHHRRRREGRAGSPTASTRTTRTSSGPTGRRSSTRPPAATTRTSPATGPAAPTGGDEAFLDANAIAGQGLVTYNVNGFSAQSYPTAVQHPDPGHRAGREPGRPGRVRGGLGQQRVHHRVELPAGDRLRGRRPTTSTCSTSRSAPTRSRTSAALDATKQFDDAAVAAGVTVVVSSGDAGSTNTIGSPGDRPERHLGRRVHRVPDVRADQLRRSRATSRPPAG